MSERSDGDSRSERLRQRRGARKERSESAETDEPSESSKPSEPDQRSERDETGKTSVKEEQVGTYMYLPESQKKELERLYNVLKAEYEYEFDDKFEKNRAFYPLLIQYGLDGLDGLDASEIRERLEDL